MSVCKLIVRLNIGIYIYIYISNILIANISNRIKLRYTFIWGNICGNKKYIPERYIHYLNLTLYLIIINNSNSTFVIQSLFSIVNLI